MEAPNIFAVKNLCLPVPWISGTPAANFSEERSFHYALLST